MALESRRSTRLSDEGGELLGRLQALWDRWGRVALIAAGVILVLGAGAFLMRRGAQNREAQAATRLAEASALYWQGEYTRSSEIARQVAQQFGNTPSGTDAQRLEGDNAFWLGDFKEAIAAYRRYLARARPGPLADGVRRSLAYSLDSDRQFAEAASTFEGLVGKFDRHSSAEFLWAAARCHRALGQSDQAVERLRRLEREFGETPYGRSAILAIAEIESGRR